MPTAFGAIDCNLKHNILTIYASIYIKSGLIQCTGERLPRSISVPPSQIPDSYTQETCNKTLIFFSTRCRGSPPMWSLQNLGTRVEARNPPLLIKKLSSQALDFTWYLWRIGPLILYFRQTTQIPSKRSVANTAHVEAALFPRSLLGNEARWKLTGRWYRTIAGKSFQHVHALRILVSDVPVSIVFLCVLGEIGVEKVHIVL